MSNITLTIPNDDHIALRAFGKALEEMALAHGAETPVSQCVKYPTRSAVAAKSGLTIEELEEMFSGSEPDMSHVDDVIKHFAQVDTTAQQVESLGEAVLTSNGVEINSEPAPDEEITGRDKSGTPWDERIHSTSKALNADGTWRLRRKPKDMDEEEWAAFVQKVQDELRFPQEPVPVTPSGEELCIDEGCDHHGTPHICVTPEPSVTPPADDFHTDAAVVTEQTVAGIPPLPVPPPVVVAPPVTEWDFPRLMTFLTERHGKIDVATVNTLLAQDGMLSVQELNAHPDKIGPFVARVKAHLGE